MIDKFNGEYRWRSNLRPAPVVVNGVENERSIRRAA